MTTIKRTVTDRSPDLEPNKKSNRMETPEKVQFSIDMSLFPGKNYEVEDEAREKDFQRIKKSDAPEWFKDAFSLMWKDLTDIRKNIKRIDRCEVVCMQNSDNLETLKSEVAEVQDRNKYLEHKLEQLDLASRKQNLIVHNIPETGPNEDTGAVIQNFFQHNLKLENVESIVPEHIFCMGKPPHLQSTAVSHPQRYNDKNEVSKRQSGSLECKKTFERIQTFFK